MATIEIYKLEEIVSYETEPEIGYSIRFQGSNKFSEGMSIEEAVKFVVESLRTFGELRKLEIKYSEKQQSEERRSVVLGRLIYDGKRNGTYVTYHFPEDEPAYLRKIKYFHLHEQEQQEFDQKVWEAMIEYLPEMRGQYLRLIKGGKKQK